MSKMLSNEKIINEIKASQRDYVKTRPEMIFKPFVNNRSERDYNLGDRGRGIMRDVIGGYKSLGQHPRYSNPVGTSAFPDPLYGGALFKNYGEFNNRGGAVLSEKMPLTGGIKADCDFYSESDKSSSESESESESESDDESESEPESESDYESESEEELGGGIYDDYIKPAGKALLNVGHEVFKDVVVPVGKELLKTAIIGLMSGAGMKGGKITGTKTEFIHILKKINPKIHMNELKKKTQHELARELYKILELGMHPEDLKTLHLLDAYAKANKKGGLGGTQKELQKILVAMYPNLNLENLSKQEIINKIKGHVDKTETTRIKTNEKRKNKRKTTKVFSSLPEYFDPEQKKIDFIPEELPSEEIEEEFFQEPEPKQTKKRGRPKSDKPKAEPKKRGRPTKEKIAKEPKKRGRPSKTKSNEPNKHLDELENLFNEVLETSAPIAIKIPKRQKKPKLDITPEPKIVSEADFLKLSDDDSLFFKKLSKAKKMKAYKDFVKLHIKNDHYELVDFMKKYYGVENTSALSRDIKKMLQPTENSFKFYPKPEKAVKSDITKEDFENFLSGYKKKGSGIKKIVGTKTGEKVRGDIVAEVMKKQGLSLGQASKYVSEHNLY